MDHLCSQLSASLARLEVRGPGWTSGLHMMTFETLLDHYRVQVGLRLTLNS